MLNWDAFNEPEEQIAPPPIKAKHDEPKQQLAIEPERLEVFDTTRYEPTGSLLMKQHRPLRVWMLHPVLKN